jgi:alpha-beta hydrolase superfamily lysophospholipase
MLRVMAITAPLLAIQGETDPYGTMAQIEDIARAVPHTQLLKLPQCGHSPHRDQPEAVAQAVQAFVDAADAFESGYDFLSNVATFIEIDGGHFQSRFLW